MTSDPDMPKIITVGEGFYVRQEVDKESLRKLEALLNRLSGRDASSVTVDMDVVLQRCLEAAQQLKT